MARLFDILPRLIPVERQRSFITGEPSEFPLLPLTPALSLRERGHRFRFWRMANVPVLRTCWLRFSLSLRERAGVRGRRPEEIAERTKAEMYPRLGKGGPLYRNCFVII